MHDDFFMVRFSDEGDYRHALFEGPCRVLDHYLMVQRWRPLFDTTDHKVQKLAVWVRIQNLSLELYNDKFLWRVGSSLGTMLEVDEHTSIHSRGRFARLCVEVDLQRELVPSFTALGKEFKIEYEGLHLICFGCGKYGHRLESCPERKMIKEKSENTTSALALPLAMVGGGTSNSGNPDVDPKSPTIPHDINQNPANSGDVKGSMFGPWMLAKKPLRRKGNLVRKAGQNQKGNAQHQSINDSN